MTKPNRLFLFLLPLTALVVCTLGLLRVRAEHQVVRLGYQLSKARETLRLLQEEQSRLRLEESVLTNPGRIEDLAKKLGMIRPTPEQLRIIEVPSRTNNAMDTQVGMRTTRNTEEQPR